MSEFIEVVSPSALKDLQALNSEIVKTIAGVKEVNSNMISIKTPSGSDSAMKALTAQYDAQAKKLQQLQKQLETTNQKQQASAEKTRLAEIRLQQQREKSFDNYEKQAQKEQALLEKSANTYEKVKAKISSMLPLYNDLRTKSELGIKLTLKEEASMALLEKRMTKYREVLNTVNKSYGNFSLEVGNYAKANSNLSNSIGQISRELPNFGQSFSVGVLSLTNNIGALIDGIKQVKAQNLELSSQGQATKSVFSQILSSVFSWQTALFIGIGIFSAYSKEIGNWVSSLWSANSALKASERAFIDAYDARMRYAGATADSTKKTQKEYEEFVLLIKGMKDFTKSQEERLNMAKRFKDAYPGYLKNFTEEQIISYSSGKANKELSKTINQLTSDIKERNLAMSESEEASKTFSLMTDLKKEFEFREAQNKLINTSKKNIREFVKQRAKDRADLMNDDEDFINKFGKITINDLGNYSSIEISTLKTRYNSLVKEFNAERSSINQKLLNTSLLDFKEDKKTDNKKEKIKLNFDYIESEYQLKLAILNRQKTELNDLLNNDKLSLEARLKARQDFSIKSIEILDLEASKEKAIATAKYLDDIEKNSVAYKNKELTVKEFNENIVVLDKRLANEKEKIDVDTSNKWNEIINADLDYYQKIEKQKQDFSRETAKMISDLEIKKFNKIKDDETKTLAIRQKAFEQSIEIQRKELDLAKIRELANSTSDEQTSNIIQKYKELNYELDNLKTPFQDAQKATDSYLEKLSSGQLEKALNDIGISSAKMFLDFDKNGQNSFDKLLEGATNLKEELAVTFQAVGDVAQDVFNKMTEMSNAHFTNEYANLEKEKEIALMFAGESASAREEIERQYAERQRQIKDREFKTKKQQAKFNIIIDTAQGIMNALASGNVPLSIAIGVIGALQLATVSAQQTPQYEHGTDNHIGGDMIINDQKGNNYKELVETPDGKKRIYEGRNVRINAPKGTKVKTASETMDYLMFNNDLNSILTGNGISNPKIELNAPSIDFTPVVDAIKNKESANISIDKSGLNFYVKNGHTIKTNTNNRINFIGKSV